MNLSINNSRHALRSLLRECRRQKHTDASMRHVRALQQSLKPGFFKGHPIYPTIGNGYDFKLDVYGTELLPSHINKLQDHIWNTKSYLPTKQAQPLPPPFDVLSDIGGKMAVKLQNGAPGLLAQNKLRETVAALDRDLGNHAIALLGKFKQACMFRPQEAKEIAQTISDLAFWSQWLIRGILFEPKLHTNGKKDAFTEPIIRKPLSVILDAMNAALGQKQLEFVYHNYTLLDAKIDEKIFEKINYDNPRSIIDGIASVQSNVGFNDMSGHNPEHNFRHNHTLMEYQMKMAFEGLDGVLKGDVESWDLIVEASRRAHQVFKTMLATTTPESYPMVRLPIKGVRGALGSVYPPHGVFYEGIGIDTYVDPESGDTLSGAYVDNEWGQTGANSSMYKFFDLLVGVTKSRKAYTHDQETLSKMLKVFKGELDSGNLGTNPIDSMQRSFDLFTRPSNHMKMLVETEAMVIDSRILEDNRPEVLLKRLELAKYVTRHRLVHGQYVMKSIYMTQPVGGQSRAQGTGGSTPPFLKLFLDQTATCGYELIDRLRQQRHMLSKKDLAMIGAYQEEFGEAQYKMGKIKSKGDELADEEGVSNQA